MNGELDCGNGVESKESGESGESGGKDFGYQYLLKGEFYLT